MKRTSKPSFIITSKKRALLDSLLQQEGMQTSNHGRIIRRKNSNLIPLSFSQQRLWLLDQLEPGNSTYNIRIAVRMSGELNLTALERSLNEVIRRHESLRTTFTMSDGQPVQVISPDLHLTLTLTDLSHLPAAEREAAARAEVTAAAQRPFDLSRGPLLRAGLVRIEDKEHVLLLVMHHIISDGWSAGVFIRELTALYEGYTRGEESGLPELPIQYADYAVWQREWLQGEVLEAQLSYWRAQLAGAPAMLELPTDKARPPVQSQNGAMRSFVLSQEVTAGLRELSRREDATLFMTLLAAWQTLLYRYSGQEDIVVGSPIAGRNRAEVEALIGFFVNTLVLRTKLSGTASFTELLRQVKEVCLGAYAHQEMPFERLVEELQPARSLSHSPLFQVMFALQNTPQQTMELGGLRLGAFSTQSHVAKFDLTLLVMEKEEGLTCAVEYSTDLFDGETIERMSRHLCNLLESVISEPERKLSEIPLLNAEERQQLLVEWNNTQAEFPSDKCVHELFEAQVARTPDAIAVVYENEQLSYRELNERANQLAHHLRELGVGAETLVGICVERSIEMVVGLLGVLKAGGAYLPLDPSYPQERLRFMLEDSAVSVLLTQQTLVETLPPHRAHVLTLDADWPLLSAYSTENPALLTDPDNLCYVIYTSGSTGTPKGTLLPHRGVCNLSTAQVHAFGLTPADTILQFASFSFDASVFEIVMALGTGATLCLSPSQPVFDGAAFLHLLREQGVTVATLPPSVLSVLEPEGLARLRAVIAAGEACPREVVARWAVGRSFYNAYGPTEATVWATNAECAAEGGKPPIGRPIDNVEVYVVDREMRVVPVGVAGELLIGGAGLARGYLNRAELTAERFVPHPYTERGGARLYRTGDEVRYLPDGQIEYLGRIDQQVKLRGFRIELGEVEAVINEHAGVRECVAMAREQEDGEKRLVAYVVSAGEEPLNATELREHVKGRLPEYMIPGVFVELEELPLTANGKIDRRALPAPDSNRLESGDEYIAPRTPVEEVLCGIWAQVLKVERVGVNDNFFALGGHSLLATQVISRVREALQVELPLRSLFERPTVSELAEALASQSGAGLQMSPLVRVRRDVSLPLSFAQERLWFINQLESSSAAYNVPSAIRFNGQLDTSALERSLEEIIRRHESLRTTFALLEGRPVQVISPELKLSLRVTDLSLLPEAERRAEVRRLAEAEAQLPFDLSAGPLFRAELLKLAEDRHVLLLTMHHIVSDGWSIGIFERELTSLYKAHTTGEESTLPDSTIQYADYAVWQREWLQGEVLEEQLGYWREQLAGAPALLELPTDRPRPAVQSQRGAVKRFVLSEELSEKLKELSRREDVTLFMTLLAAWQTLLYRYSGQEDIVVGSPIAGRNRAELEELIGFFINTLVLRARLNPRMEFRELLKQVREVCLGAYAHQEMPFERLVEELQPARSLSHSPLFQVMFALQNTPQQAMELGGLRLGAFSTQSHVAKFDLTLFVSEGERSLSCALEYNTDLFDEATVERMWQHLRNLLEAISVDPQQKLSEIPLLGAEERQQLLIEWNDTATVFPTDKCVHELFEAQATRTPNAIAVVYEDQQLTYGELNEKANQLAHHLRELGVREETLVGICVERSVEMIVGLLGILKAGGAYLPLDPAYPQERLRFMLDDARVSVLLTQQALVETLPSYDGKVLTLDADWALLSSYSTENPASLSDADNLCYVIYTSGSTGTPKGVAVTHSSLVNLVCWHLRTYNLAPGERTTQMASPAFDAAAWEIWPALAGGCSLLVVGEAERGGGRRLWQWLEREGARVSFAPTPVAETLLAEAGERASGGMLRRLLTGGDRLRVWSGEAMVGRLVNHYGPTEATVVTTSGEVAVAGEGVPPIGRPIANAEVYVVDGEMRIVPVGVAGELLIGGAVLARGYVNRAELTAERFVPHPYAREAGARVYRTGDVVRYLRDGQIEFIGRRDEQVKVRGFRIELGEIEAALGSHGGVRECVVVAREDEGAEKRLVAYMVAVEAVEAGEAVSVSELREHVRERLPEYMVPSAFVMLEELPLTANGKVDRRALPAPEQGRPRELVYAEPVTELERMIAAVWGELLNLERVGLEDNFFDLGGYSLLLVKAHDRITSAVGKEISILEMFTYPTVQSLANHLSQTVEEESGLLQKSYSRAEARKSSRMQRRA